MRSKASSSSAERRNGWVAIGSFTFDAGGDQWMALNDAVSGSVVSDQHIAADAIRLTRLDGWCGDGTCDDDEGCDCPDDCAGPEETCVRAKRCDPNEERQPAAAAPPDGGDEVEERPGCAPVDDVDSGRDDDDSGPDDDDTVVVDDDDSAVIDDDDDVDLQPPSEDPFEDVDGCDCAVGTGRGGALSLLFALAWAARRR